MDVYLPPDLKPLERRPVVVFIHGGAGGVYLTQSESILLMGLIVSAVLLIAVGGYIVNNSRAAQR